MATNRQIVTSALRMIGVIDADETASVEDAELGLSELNSLMAILAADGIDLGYPPQESLSDDFPLDEQAIAQVKPLLAVHLLPYYPSSSLTTVLAARAEQARAQLLRAAVLANREESTPAVPMGSGWGYFYDINTGE